MISKKETTIDSIETSIKDIYLNLEKWKEKKIRVKGWVKSVRSQREQLFITISDGSTLNTLQIVISSQESSWKQAKQLNYSSGVIVTGKLIMTPERSQNCELKETEILWMNLTSDKYPLQKQKISLETLREYPHLRCKTKYFLNLFRLRHFVSKYINEFLSNKNFYNLPTPIMTKNDSEGTGETFNIRATNNEIFFSENIAKLTVSGQLHLETLSQGLGKVYSFNSCFRAERSHTNRHLTEFWMVEVEMLSSKLAELLDLAETLIKKVLQSLLKKNLDELQWLEKYNNEDIVNSLKEIVAKKFKRITYEEAIIILQTKIHKNLTDKLQENKLLAEQEKKLCEHFKCPVFVTNYPEKNKAFYMKNDSAKQTVINFDLLVPELGELIGGSLREDCYQTLKEKIKNPVDQEKLEWYLDLRKFGYLPTGGFGLGLERLLMWIGKVKNIRDTIPFPRYFKSIPC